VQLTHYSIGPTMGGSRAMSASAMAARSPLGTAWSTVGVGRPEEGNHRGLGRWNSPFAQKEKSTRPSHRKPARLRARLHRPSQALVKYIVYLLMMAM
jgi:hypothetical protein